MPNYRTCTLYFKFVSVPVPPCDWKLKERVGTKFSDVKKCFWFLCRITYYTVRFFHILIDFHYFSRVRYRRKDFKGNTLHWERRFGYDIRKCPIYRGRYMRGFLLELSLDGTGTWVSVRYKRLSGLSEDVIREVYCIYVCVCVCVCVCVWY